MPNDREPGVHANLFADQNLVQMVHTPNRLIVERNNQIPFAQSGALGGTILLHRNNQDSCLQRQTIKSYDPPVNWHVLPSDADITTADSSIADQPASNQSGGVAGDREADALRRSNHGRVYPHYFAC